MKKIVGMFIIFMFIAFDKGFAEIPEFTVILGEKAYSLRYVNDDQNIKEIRKSMRESDGIIFIKTKNKWYRNDNTIVNDINEIPKVTNIKGYPKYNNDDSTEDIFLSNKSLDANIRISNGIVKVYNPSEQQWFKLSQNIDNLNERYYNLTEYLLQNNNKNGFIRGRHGFGIGKKHSAVMLGLVSDKETRYNHIFTYEFYDRKMERWDNENITLEIEPLSDEESGKYSLEKYYYTQYYVTRLKKSIEIVFYDKDYESICDLIMKKYDKFKEYTQEGIGDKMFKDEDFIDGIKVITERSYNGFKIYFEL